MSRRISPLAGAAAAVAAATVVVLAHPAAAASLVQVTNFGDNPGGAEMYVYVPNTHPANPAVNGWSLVFTLPSGQTVTGGWNAAYNSSTGQVTARNLSYNASIAAGGSVSIGFQATHTGNTAAPAGFSLNGNLCAAG